MQPTECGLTGLVMLTSVLETVEVVNSPVLNGLELSPRGNKWCPGWRESVAVLYVLFFPLVSCSSSVVGS